MVNFFNGIINMLKGVLSDVINMLPKSPFVFDSAGEFTQIMGYVNYFIPINRMVQITKVWLSAIVIWYVAMTVLRWVKAIE
ncbi:MAG: hypothetical protein RSA70_07005 [Clostridia bacterium]